MLVDLPTRTNSIKFDADLTIRYRVMTLLLLTHYLIINYYYYYYV